MTEDFEQEWNDDWDDQPSGIRSRRNRDAIDSLGDQLRSLQVEFRDSQKICIRSDERLDLIVKRVERLEQIVFTGTNSMTTRIFLLENEDKNFNLARASDKKELDEIKALIKLIKGYPFGLSGLVCTIIMVIITIAAVTDVTVRNYALNQVRSHIEGN
ncbi:MAG: hypothetical protein VKL42_12505 [Snowella sp.]|nr:hypothetical protein [Snowella sp.]